MDILNQIDLNNELSHNEQCVRCKVTAANFICDECQHNTLYCSNCDGYIHSLSSKRHHQRRFIQEPINDNYLPISEATNKLNSKAQSTKYSCRIQEEKDRKPFQQMTISQNYINEIKEIFEKEKEEITSKLNLSNKQLLHTTSALNERIEYLHCHIESMKRDHKHEIEQILNEQNGQTSQLIHEQEDQIGFLQEKIRGMEEVISNQLKKIKEYERTVYDTEGTFKNQLDNVTCNLEKVHHENNSMKQFYERRIADLTQIAGEDKNKIATSYEETIHQLKEGYQMSKVKYLEVIQQREDDMKEMIQNNQKERNELNSIIDQLKKNYDSIKKDQDELIVMNEKLKQGLEKSNEIIEENTKKINQYSTEKKDFEKKLDEIQQDNEQLNGKIEKINRITYGKFNPQKHSIQKKRKINN